MKAGILLALAASLLALSAAFARPATSANASRWYWTPGACKSELQHNGVAINDGRTFHVEKAFCVGYHNHCWLDRGARRYKVFVAVMRSYDGVVRGLQLTVTGQHTWSGTGMKIHNPSMSLSQFVGTYGPTAWNVAAAENQGGCFDVHP